VNIFFSFIYLVEVGVKLCYWSWGQYWLSIDNRFDFVTTMILAGVGVAFLLFTVDPAILQYFNMVRLMRIVRLLKALNNIPSYRMQVDVITKMVGTCWDVLMMNVLVIYLWSAAGNQLFGGELYASNPKLKSQDLSYFDSHYQIYNFNDLLLGLVTLFFFMLGSWNDALASVCMGLSKRLTLSWFLAGFFHLSFYVAGPVLAFNVYTAFSIDVFIQLKEFSEGEDGGDREIDLVRKLRGVYMAELAEKGYCLHIEETSEFSRMKVQRSMLDKEADNMGRYEDFLAAVSRIRESQFALLEEKESDDLLPGPMSRLVSRTPSLGSLPEACQELARADCQQGRQQSAGAGSTGSLPGASEEIRAARRLLRRHTSYREMLCAKHAEEHSVNTGPVSWARSSTD